ncbi:hypothetical protein MF406_14245 [Georgenia sp. TF02-10]|uniref:hypothetical protein n=1 Tax=Georgenia sp. TF02-10 TaxID=2917725 RepID=UPI001FA769D8|nr:hypothetical protein [Georgenia sp. TF02-10]UNX54093.1 hypothetical protein MF406_14245 [Georgenia sp. TF02-10]
MAARRNLRALPAPEPPGGAISKAAASSRRDLLVALRDSIAARLDEGVPPRDMASLSLRLVNIVDEIAALDAEENGDDVGSAAGTPDAAWPAS